MVNIPWCHDCGNPEGLCKCGELPKNWLAEQCRLAHEEVEKWPEWKRKELREEIKRYG